MLERLFAGYRKLTRILRGLRLTLWIRMAGGRVGSGLQLERGVLLRWFPHRGISIGRNVYLGRGVILDVPRGGRLILGSSTKIMHYTVLASATQIAIGSFTQVAEHCSIRDADHGMELGVPMLSQSITSSVQIGDDVWIGRGSAVLRGSNLGEGCVVGANSVVRGEIPKLGIAVGAPARVVRSRQDASSRTDGSISSE